MSGAIEASAYPWTRVYSRDYTEVIWDSRKDEGTAELFVIRSWSGRTHHSLNRGTRHERGLV